MNTVTELEETIKQLKTKNQELINSNELYENEITELNEVIKNLQHSNEKTVNYVSQGYPRSNSIPLFLVQCL